ncbi:MAG: PDDEXK nuclease domain-containing protein [Bacteroidales bacterium]|nr:PDDEXK nuclease domain-containing protein [Bacteroidales bacterium]
MNKQVKQSPIEQEAYDVILRQAVAVIETTRYSIAKHTNGCVISAYWQIGQLLYERKIESGYGDGVVLRLSADLKERYPKFGASPRNLWDMKKFYLRFRDSDIKVRQAVAVLPWGHILQLMQKIGDDDMAILYYAQEIVEKGWTRELLLNAIKLRMHESQAIALVDNNFEKTLPAEQASYANEVFSSTYNLGFLGVTSPILELELEERLVKAITRFLMELGRGFTFIGNQHTLEYNGKESKVDMLFFHRGLRCLVAVDLKIGAFKPEFAGKMNYYLSLLDRLERGADENRSIGIILCAEKDKVEVELALEDMGKPIGVADYQLIVPKDELKKVLCDEMKAFSNEKAPQKH